MSEIINRPSAFIGLRKTIAEDLKRGVRQLLLHVVNDQMIHAEVLAGGRDNWRAAFVKDLGAAFGNSRAQADDLANNTFQFFDQYWIKRYGLEITPRLFLDKVYVNTGPTQDEIDNAWEVDIASSESAMSQMYEGSARHRKGKDHGLKSKLERVH